MPQQTVEEAAKETTNIFKVDDNYDDHAYGEGHYKGFLRGAAWQKEQGIDWIEVAIEKPPIDETEKNIVCSVSVLTWAEGHKVVEGIYFHDFGGWRCHGAGNWQPTHWAFINLPKTDK